ncbi:MAG: ABC transporter ATP-binding protein [Elusimicrobia bacterium]|nr:ABC transporter ATP-binding protein [Elusimicrobiota bacterium]
MNRFVYQIKNLTKLYKGAETPANDQVTLTIEEGDIVGLLGPNGAGKSTLVRQMLGLLKPSEGRIWLYGQDIVQEPQGVADHVSYVSQGGLGAGFWQLKAEEIVTAIGKLRRLTKAQAQEAADYWFDRLAIGRLKDKLLGHLSGGERRLISLAGALVGTHSVLLADEPTNDLDPLARLRVWETLRDLNHERNLTIFLVTHNALEADKVVSRLGLMDKGRLLVWEPVASLKAKIHNLYVEILDPPLTGNGLKEEIARYPKFLVEENRWKFLCPPDDAGTLLELFRKNAQTKEGLHYRIRTATLEDLYFELGTANGFIGN